jgi:hypothetical protein
MKAILSVVCLACLAFKGWGATTIDPNHPFAYGANIAWLNWQGDGANGAVITEDICSGFVWSANCGWIHLGDGSPENAPQYQNNSATDYGVNLDALGNLSGFAYGANIGWLTFDPLGQPKIDLLTGDFSGSIWSANCGWISLSNTFAHVRAQLILPAADQDKDGLPDAWELRFARSLDVLTAADDSDGDGVSNRNEALADTDPFDANDALRITRVSVGDGGNEVTIQWNSRPNRMYRVLKTSDLGPGASAQDVAPEIVVPGTLGEASLQFQGPGGSHGFFSIEALKPLKP